MQKLIRKAFREAKAARQKAKEKARAARAQAAKEQQVESPFHNAIQSRRCTSFILCGMDLPWDLPWEPRVFRGMSRIPV